MSLTSFLQKQFIDVIQWNEPEEGPSFSIIRVDALFPGMAIETIRSSRTRSKASRSASRAASVARP
jgi:membrane protease subunit (stomatin/prohibitin family)